MFGALFRTLMILLSFLLFLAIDGAVAVATIAAGPLWNGLPVEQLPTLLPQGGGAPSPFFIAAAAALVATLVLGMIAMLISEKVYSTGAFVAAVFKTAFVLAILFAIPLGLFLFKDGVVDLATALPLILFFVGTLAGAIVASVLLAWPFIFFVSERPKGKRFRRKPRPTPPPAPAPAEPDETAHPAV